MSLLYRSQTLADVEVRADGRTLVGTVVPYGVETRIGSYVESFARGAFDGTDPAAVPLLVAHRHAALPIGHAATLHDEPAHGRGVHPVRDPRRRRGTEPRP